MKRIIGFLLVFAILSLCGCSSKADIEVTGCEIVSAGDAYNVKFTLLNNTDHTIKGLGITVSLMDDSGAETEKAQSSYPIAVSPKGSATLTVKGKKGIAKAKALSYSYTIENGETVSADFKKDHVAEISEVKTAQNVIKTRAEVADELIQDIKYQFLKKQYLTDGTYDEEKKQLIIASYCDLSLSECKASYRMSPDQWNELSQSISQMSSTCIDEFKSNGFDDVHVSIGFMSNDDQIIISATDGEIVDTLAE